ncbi:MAG: alkaline phosphatase, partial [Caldimonas sp.]
QSRIDAARTFNPHIHYGRGDQRGYVRFRLDAKQLEAQLRVVDRPLDPASGVTTAARFVVDPAKPGAVSA